MTVLTAEDLWFTFIYQIMTICTNLTISLYWSGESKKVQDLKTASIRRMREGGLQGRIFWERSRRGAVDLQNSGRNLPYHPPPPSLPPLHHVRDQFCRLDPDYYTDTILCHRSCYMLEWWSLYWYLCIDHHFATQLSEKYSAAMY